jgi:hypothetical protein
MEAEMSATQETVGPGSDVGRLLQDIADSPSVQLRVDSGDNLFIVWLMGKNEAQYGCHADQWWTAGTDRWHVMAKYGAIQRVRFVRAPDPHTPERETLSIRLTGVGGSSTLRADSTPLYDEQNQPIAAPFARWEELRAKYGGGNEVRVENGMMIPSVEAARK